MGTVSLRPFGVVVGEYLNAGGFAGFDPPHYPESTLVGGGLALADNDDASYAYLSTGDAAETGAPYFGIHQDWVGGELPALTIDPATVTDLTIRARFTLPSVADETKLGGNGHTIGVYVYDATTDETLSYAGWDATTTPAVTPDTTHDFSLSLYDAATAGGLAPADAIAAIRASYTDRLATHACQLLAFGYAPVPSSADYATDYPNFAQIFEVELIVTYGAPVMTGSLNDGRRIMARRRR